MRAPRGGAAGFTLIELLVVLVLMGALAAIVTPRFQAAMPGAETRATARLLESLLRDARTEALASGRPVDVAFDGEARRFTATSGVGAVAVPASVTVRFETVRLPYGPGPQRLRFYDDGSTNGGRIVLSSGAAEREIDIDWLTGLLDVS
ncbi:MAG: GspH/FimT family pseudopilin [Alphaproteobacteria bacterium]|nr:GspH/FimT family pseudopilin [Alphaproteobacteria bacterium]